MTREDAIEIIKAYRDRLTNSISNLLDKDIEAFEMAIKALEEKPKTGHWIDEFGGCECSECGCLEGGHSDYCPNCGAKMEEQESEEAANDYNR